MFASLCIRQNKSKLVAKLTILGRLHDKSRKSLHKRLLHNLHLTFLGCHIESPECVLCGQVQYWQCWRLASRYLGMLPQLGYMMPISCHVQSRGILTIKSSNSRWLHQGSHHNLLGFRWTEWLNAFKMNEIVNLNGWNRPFTWDDIAGHTCCP